MSGSQVEDVPQIKSIAHLEEALDSWKTTIITWMAILAILQIIIVAAVLLYLRK